MAFSPSVTVAGIIERDGEFLLVEEETDAGLRFNQPAGHWEDGETLVAAVAREVLEESRYLFRPRCLVGIYSWRRPASELTYLRFAFAGDIVGYAAERALDAGIVAAHWLGPAAIAAVAERHRSPLVGRCIDDYRAGKRYPLELLMHFDA